MAFSPTPSLPHSAPSKPYRILSVFGTRPEAIKMAPVVKALQSHPEWFESRVCVTAQHRDMLDQVLNLFQIQPHHDLNVMQPNQDLYQITAGVLLGMRDVLRQERPNMVLVHGDTTTTMATSLACFYERIPVGHIEAGLRTFDLAYPFPEELNRWVTDTISHIHFAPTPESAGHLTRTLPQASHVVITGNTVIDALLMTLKTTQPSPALQAILDGISPSQRLIVCTTHRRENFGEPLEAILSGLEAVLNDFDDTVLVLPVHPNPNVKPRVFERLGHHPRVFLIEPLEYADFCHLMQAATLILTDSGGVQEEAPSLGKPVLVLRDTTERPEAVSMGTVRLVGPHTASIVQHASELLQNPAAYAAMAQAVNPYGDGQACDRIIAHLKNILSSL
ncbi:MAG: UDP-N-acetylglucosamine 2-epimerase (non-hydrolyzing) [Vampirovibrionales bacterium]